MGLEEISEQLSTLREERCGKVSNSQPLGFGFEPYLGVMTGSWKNFSGTGKKVDGQAL